MFDVVGEKVDPNEFKDYKKIKVYEYYDFPRVILMESPNKEKWVFSWADNNERELENKFKTIDSQSIDNDDKNVIYDFWIAFRISENRYNEIENGDISLRELILLCETFEKNKDPNFFVLKSLGLYNFIEVIKTLPERIPLNILPLEDTSLVKSEIEKQKRTFDNKRLNLDIHFIPDNIRQGYIPLSHRGPFEEHLQNIITRCSYRINNPGSQEIITGPQDWTMIEAGASISGSFRFYCESSVSDKEKVEILQQSCNLLKDICNKISNEKILDKYQINLNENILLTIEMFLKHIIQFDISVNIKWIKNGMNWEYLMINKRTAQIVLDYLENKVKDEYFSEDIYLCLTLTAEEVSLIMKPVDPHGGGWQSVLFDLQKKLKEDNTLELAPYEIDKIVSYTFGHGQGGFQTRLQGVVNALERLKKSLTGLR
jgi:hypothetical protein